MNARMVSDQVIDRSRSIWRMAENMERADIKSALLDITIDTALELASRSVQLVDQYEGAGQARQLRVMRELLTMWRKIIRSVKSVNPEHPIHDCHLYVILLDFWGNRLSTYEKLFEGTCSEVKLLYYERFGLRPYSSINGSTDMRARKVTRSRVREVLSSYYAV